MTRAAQVRQAKGLSRREAADRAQISEGYLRRVERHGAPYRLAQRLARIYSCPVEIFLPERKPRKGGR